MPIEIRELVIRATVGRDPAPEPRPTTETSRARREELVEECVEQVLEILRRRKER